MMLQKKIRLFAYVTLCRPLLLEYACEIWDPTTQFLITKLADVQSNSLHYVSVTDSRVLLGLDTLQAIRKNKRIILFHIVLEYESFFPGLLNAHDQMKANHDFNTRHSSTFNSIVCITNNFLQSFLTARRECSKILKTC